MLHYVTCIIAFNKRHTMLLLAVTLNKLYVFSLLKLQLLFICHSDY